MGQLPSQRRGHREPSGSLFSNVSIEERIPASHPLQRIRKLADQTLDRLNPTFCELYASEGRPSVPPEQLNDNLLFRWRDPGEAEQKAMVLFDEEAPHRLSTPEDPAQ